MAQQKTVTWAQLQTHTLPSDCWFVVDGYVYNATDFLVEHPGGDQILVKWSGLDASVPFGKVNHSQYAKSLRNARVVGKIESNQYPEGYQERLKTKKQKQAKKKKRRIILEPVDPAIIKRHASEDDCWIIISGKIYDVTNYLEDHPGGVGKIMEFAGKDATAAFEGEGHSVDAIKIKEEYYIGEVKKSSSMPLIIFAALVVGLIGFCNFM